jgi:hypothetical protein
MVVTRSYASKYNLKLNSGLENIGKKYDKYDNHYVFTFLYYLFCLLIPLFLYCVLLYFTNYYYNKNVNNALMPYKEYNFILLENNLPEKTFEYLSDNLYNKLPAKPYEKNFNYFDYLFNEILYNYDAEDNYNYYIDFF